MLIALWAQGSVWADGGETSPPILVAVQVAKVVKATLTRTVTAYGRVEPDVAGQNLPPAIVHLSPAVAGIITETHGVEGQPVKKGDVLFKLDSRAVDADVAKAQLAVQFAQKNAQRQSLLAVSGNTPEKQVLEAGQMLATAEAELATAELNQSFMRGMAPMSGILTMMSARPGEAADSSKVLVEIIDMDRLIGTVQVPRIEASELKPGLTVRASSPGTSPFQGTVVYISPVADPTVDTILVRFSISKGSGVWPGAFLTAQFVVDEHKDVLSVPETAIYTDHEGKSTVSMVEGDLAIKHEVKAGLHDGGLVEVEGGGVAEGTTVVTVGSYALPEETRVTILQPAVEEVMK